ncbi:hypothetical protein ACLMJK_001638 [Lecanora helva]
MSSVEVPPPSSREQTKRPVVCVFCGSSKGTSQHVEAAVALAHAFADQGISLVYGGGTTGIMGELAKTLVSRSGPESVHGIIPEALVEFEQAGRPGTPNATAPKDPTANQKAIFGRTTVVKTMHTRKQLMAKEVMEGGPGSGFVALSGGFGTMEELMEMTTWNQLGIHNNGVVVFNVGGFYDGLIQWVKTAVSEGFIAPRNGGILVEALDAEEVVKQLKEYQTSEERFNLDWSEK